MFYILQKAKYISFINTDNKLGFQKKGVTMQLQVKNNVVQIPTKLYRIGELVDYTPFSRQTIHNYTIMGLIREAKWTQGGHRLYDESVFERLSEIMRLRKTKTLSQIRAVFRTKEERNSPSGKSARK